MLKILFFLFSVTIAQAQQVFNNHLELMGNRFDITVVAKNRNEANGYITLAINEIKRIEKMISSWDSNSETSLIIESAGIKPVVVSKELYDLIERSLAISRLTDGAFDISYASMDKIWRFDGTMKQLPSEDVILSSVAKVGYQNIILDKENHSVFLKEMGMKIGFGAIGKGYAADKAKDLLISEGVKAGIINASGDMNTWGEQPNGEKWQVAITNPFAKDKGFGFFSLTDEAVATSGDYEKYVEFNGIRYEHIINPKTGYPATGITSVTVFAPKAELADALATSIFVMGIDVGIDLVNQLPKIQCILIDHDGNLFKSTNININTHED